MPVLLQFLFNKKSKSLRALLYYRLTSYSLYNSVRALPRYINRQGAIREEASPPSLWRTASMARPHIPENDSGGTAPLYP
jgi:hypothetical protein